MTGKEAAQPGNLATGQGRAGEANLAPAITNRNGLTISQAATMACLLEASVPKPGNVHRGADFADMTFYDFAVSAALIGPILETASQCGVGLAALRAVQATRAWVPCNTNLGTILLLAPLAAAAAKASEQSSSAGSSTLAAAVANVLDHLTPDDARDVYEAIRLANPGGLGTVDEADVADEPPADLRAAMALAADRDLVARQYANGFTEVLGEVVPLLADGLRQDWSLPDSVIYAAVSLMHAHPDSLIARKCGPAVAQQSAEYAGAVLKAGPVGSGSYFAALADLDFWLRADGHRRNPGTTADLIAAGLFAALWEGIISPPMAFVAQAPRE